MTMKKRMVGKIAIHLVDMYLIFFMLILLIYMGIRLFWQVPNSQDSSAVDIVVRTSAVAIFGYFLSGNFAKNGSQTTSVQTSVRPEELIAEISPENPVKNQIGFVKPEAESPQIGTLDTSTQIDSPQIVCSKMQVWVVATISLISLIILMIAREMAASSPETAAAISQFRDYVSAGVGFLISCGRRAEK